MYGITRSAPSAGSEFLVASYKLRSYERERVEGAFRNPEYDPLVAASASEWSCALK